MLTFKTNKQAFSFVVLILLLISSLYLFDKQSLKLKTKNFSKLKIEGVVLKKYTNFKNHSHNTVAFSSLDSEIVFENEVSGVFYFLLEGDSIYKAKNSLSLLVFRENKLNKVFNIKFEKEKLN